MQMRCKAEEGHRRDPPFGRIEVEPLVADAVVARERMVEVVVPFAEGEEVEPPAVARGLVVLVRLLAVDVRGGVDQERAVVEDDQADEAAPEETADGAAEGEA